MHHVTLIAMDLKLNTQETRNQSGRELPKTTGINRNLPCGCACRNATFTIELTN